ncbi:MAG TPA: DUF2069 domain-containing protein [Moraxellaceae bacterium]|nr:DUF2069 domain-containing protein [Moraxellaceae bacterium]
MPPVEKFRRGSRAAFALLVLLMAFLAVETALKPLPAGAMLVFGAALLLPLALFLRPLWRGNADSALWLSLMLLPYLCWALLGAFVPGTEGLLALLRALLIGACFTALMLMVRWHRAARG